MKIPLFEDHEDVKKFLSEKLALAYEEYKEVLFEIINGRISINWKNLVIVERNNKHFIWEILEALDIVSKEYLGRWKIIDTTSKQEFWPRISGKIVYFSEAKHAEDYTKARCYGWKSNFKLQRIVSETEFKTE